MGAGTKEGRAQCCSVKGSHLVFWKVDAMWALKKKKHQTSGGEGWRDGDRVGRIG